MLMLGAPTIQTPKHADTHGLPGGKYEDYNSEGWNHGSPVNLTYDLQRVTLGTDFLNPCGFCGVHKALWKLKSPVQRGITNILSPTVSTILIFIGTQLLAPVLRYLSASVPPPTLTISSFCFSDPGIESYLARGLP